MFLQISLHFNLLWISNHLPMAFLRYQISFWFILCNSQPWTIFSYSVTRPLYSQHSINQLRNRIRGCSALFQELYNTLLQHIQLIDFTDFKYHLFVILLLFFGLNQNHTSLHHISRLLINLRALYLYELYLQSVSISTLLISGKLYTVYVHQ